MKKPDIIIIEKSKSLSGPSFAEQFSKDLGIESAATKSAELKSKKKKEVKSSSESQLSTPKKRGRPRKNPLPIDLDAEIGINI